MSNTILQAAQLCDDDVSDMRRGWRRTPALSVNGREQSVIIAAAARTAVTIWREILSLVSVKQSYRDKVTIEHRQETIYPVYRMVPLSVTGISRSRYLSTLNISEATRDRAIVTNNRTSIGSHRLCIERWHFQWPSRILNSVFKVMTFFEVEFLKNGTFYGQSYYSTVIGNHT